VSTNKHTREALRQSAVRHKPFDEAERKHQQSIADWLVTGSDDPFDRKVFVPGHATGSCFVTDEDGHAALIFHKNLKLWVQPGGHFESGETDPMVAAGREAEEELGISLNGALPVLFDLDVHRIAPRGETPSHIHYDFRGLAVIDHVDLAPASDAAEAKWLTRKEIASLGVDPGVRRMADKAVAEGLLAV
jgi:8-oxo-dGTP pyrophosphatase MutT (NUDIX family)